MRHIVFGLFVFYAIHAHTQTNDKYDTAKRLDPFSTSIQTLYRNFEFKQATDSNLLYYHQYYAAKKQAIAIQDLGDMATPYLPLLFTPNLNTGFNAGFNPFGNNYFYLKNAKFFTSKLPFTQFYYVQGRGLTQQGLVSFDAEHTQNIGKNFNIAAKYHSTTNSGYYLRQTNALKNVQLTSYYRSKNKRYLATIALSYNKSNMLENGGLLQDGNYTDSLFRELPQPVKSVEVELKNAKNINRFRQHQFAQTYWLVGKYSNDTLKNFKPQLGIKHALNLDKQTNYFTNLKTDFNSIIFDSIYNFNANGSFDSMRYRGISNSIEIFTPLNTNGLSFTAGAIIDNIQYYQQANSLNYRNLRSHNTSVYGQLNFSLLKIFLSQANAQIFTTGYNQKDFFLNLKNEIVLLKKQQISAEIGLTSSAKRPDYQQQFMLSNHFIWQNNFNQITTQQFSFGLHKDIKKPNVYNAYNYSLPKKSFDFTLNYYLTSNYIYFDTDAKPKAGAADQSVLQFYGSKHFNFKRLQFNQSLFYQVFSDKIKTHLLLPNFASKSSLYVQFYAFKKATFLQIGTDISYIANYTANFYNPATRQFQRSNKQVGNYPFVDLFINAEIKTAKIFFKMEHLNQDMAIMNGFNNYYYNSPFQPSSPRRFRLGLAWKFYY